jgi:hypothetical protein
LNKVKIKHEDCDITLIKDINLNELYCKIHQKENLFEYLCLDCENIICKTCITDLSHKTHQLLILKESKDKIKEINNNIKKKLENEKENLYKMLLLFDEKELKILDNIKKLELNLEENKNKKQEVLFEYLKLLNFHSISDEKPIQFLLDSNNFINNNKNMINIKNNDKIYKKILSFGCNYYKKLGSFDLDNILVPTLVNFNLEVKKIFCSFDSTFIITSNIFNNI